MASVFIVVFVLVFLACALAAYSIYIVFCNTIFDLIIDPLTMPSFFLQDAIFKRERRMTFVIFFCLPLLWVGAAMVFGANIYWCFKHFRPQLNAGGRRFWLPIIPKIALSELLAIVFSVAFLPIFTRLLLRWYEMESNSRPASDQEMNKSVLILSVMVALSFVPLCFASAFHRLDGNKVPIGPVRLLFLFLYPYMITAMHPGLIGFVAVPLNLMTLVSRGVVAWTNIAPCLGSWAILALGAYLAWKAKQQAVMATANPVNQ